MSCALCKHSLFLCLLVGTKQINTTTSIEMRTTNARFPLPELTARVDGWSVSITRQHGPCWRACVSLTLSRASGHHRLYNTSSKRDRKRITTSVRSVRNYISLYSKSCKKLYIKSLTQWNHYIEPTPERNARERQSASEAVSYTHLTLPTIYSV